MSENTLKSKQHITGEERARVGAELVKKYGEGASVRQLAEETGRSFGWVNTILKESGATMRSRGGAHAR